MAKKTEEAPRRRVPLTTSKWEEGGVEEFPGTLLECTYRDSDEKYNEVRGLPRPIDQFHIVVERMDAIYDLADGTEAPVKAYCTVDLERLTKAGQLIPVPAGQNKATFVIGGWEKAKVKLDPDPTTNEGKKFMFRRWRTKLFGSGPNANPAKDLIVPIKPLASDYEYEGEVKHFAVAERAEGEDLESAASEKGEKNGASARASTDDSAVLKQLAQAINGWEEDDDFSELLTSDETKDIFKGRADLKKMVTLGEPLIEKLTAEELIVVKKGKIKFVGEE